MLYGYTTFNMSMYRLKGHLGCFHILINLNNSAMTGEGNGNPLQYSCLENPMGGGAWRAAVHGVARVGHDLPTKPTNQLVDTN